MSAAYWNMKRQAERYKLTMAQHNADIKLTNMTITHELLREGQPGYGEPMPLRRDALPSHLVFTVTRPEDVKTSPYYYYYPEDVPALEPPPKPVIPIAKQQPLAKPPGIALQTLSEPKISPQEERQRAISAAQDAGDWSDISKSGYSRSKSKEFI